MAYATLVQVKNSLRITDNVDDLSVQMAIDSATEMIDGYCGRTFLQNITTRVFVAYADDVVEIDDLTSLTTLKTASSTTSGFDTTWTAGYQLEPLNGVSAGKTGWPYTRIRAIDKAFPQSMSGEQALVQITGTFGWASVPNSVVQACVIQASRLFKRSESPMGVAGYGDLGVMRITSKYLDGDVTQLLDDYRLVKSVG
jgi:hypothetical protein